MCLRDVFRSPSPLDTYSIPYRGKKVNRQNIQRIKKFKNFIVQNDEAPGRLAGRMTGLSGQMNGRPRERGGMKPPRVFRR